MQRRLLDLIGKMDERFPLFFNDVDWCRRVQAAGGLIDFYPEAKILHRRGVSVNAQPYRKIWRSHQGFYRYFEKYNRRPWQRAANQLIGLLLILAATIRSAVRLLK